MNGQSYLKEYLEIINISPIDSKSLDQKVDSLIKNALLHSQVIEAIDITHKYSLKNYLAGNYEKAITYGSREIFLYEKHHIKSIDYSNAVFNIGFFYRIASKNIEAKNAYLKVIELNIDPNKIGRAYTDIAKILENEGDYYEAINYFEKSLAIFDENDNQKEQHHTYISIAHTYELIQTKESRVKELAYINKALRLSKSVPLTNNDRISLYNKYANYYTTDEVYNFNKASKFFQKSLQIANKQKDSTYLSTLYGNLGRLHYLNEKKTSIASYDSIKYYLNKSFQYQSSNSTQQAINNYRIYYKYFILKKDFDSALKYNIKSLSANLKSSSVLKTTPSLNELIKAENPHDIISILMERGSLFLENDYVKKDASEALKNFIIADSILNHLHHNTRADESKLFWRSLASSIYLGAVNAAYENGDDELMLHYIEKNKAFLLKENLLENISKISFPNYLLKRENILKENINKLKNQSSTTGSNLNGDIFDAKLKLRDFQDSLKTIISKKNLTQTEVKVLSLREIQQNLSPNTAVLTYLWNFNPNKRTDADLQSQFGMVISKNTIQSFKIESNQGVHALINNFKNQISQPYYKTSDLKRNKKYADSIRSILIPKKIYNSIKNCKNLIIITDGELQNIPFEALTSFDKKKRFLIEDFTINYAYSMSYTRVNESTVRYTNQDLVTLAPITFNKNNLKTLSNTAREVQEINNIISGKMYLNEEANKKHFLNHTNNARIIHLATHADGSSNPWIAFNDGKLQARELYTYHNNAELVVLSGCETSLGEIAQGEGVMSLARGFFYAGANTVVSSLWSVNDKSTSQIMKSFYTHLKNGETKAVALNNAKLDYLKNASVSEISPYYWSSFILVGDGEGVLYGSYSATTLTVVTVLIIIIMVFYIFHKKYKNVG